MRKIFQAFFFSLLFTSVLQAQNTGTINGTVYDGSGTPLEAASVALTDRNNEIVSGAISDATGSFTIENVPFGIYNLEISLIGFNSTTVADITVNHSNRNVNVGRVVLTVGEVTTDEIIVESERSRIEFRPDRRIFNIGDDINLRGGTALDVLKEIPSVTVDIDGNVSVRGSENVRILIDGRPSGLDGSSRTVILEQITADQIERVELITNPSARFDPEGSSGIVNIVLKKSNDFGYNGNISLNAGTRDKYTGSLGLNIRKDNYNIFGNYSYNSMNFESSGQNFRQSTVSSNSSIIDQNESGFRRRLSNMVSGGIDYSFTSKTLLGFSLRYREGDRKSSGSYFTREFDASGNLTSDYVRKSNADDTGHEIDASLRFQQIFSSPDHRLTADINFSKEKDDEVSFSADEYQIPFTPEPTRINELTNEDESRVRIQVDYGHPLGKDTKFETGYSGNLYNQEINSDNRFYDYTLNEYVTDDNLSNRFKYEQQIHSLYGILTGEILNTGYSFGLRAEQTIINGNLLTTGESFDNDYVDFFPSISFSRKIGLTQELQLSYSRRIQRPRQRFLNPFVRLTDPLNISTGNPNLKPEFTNSFELNYINYFPFGTITPSIFYRRTTDGITRVRTLIDSVTTLTTFENLNSSQNYGGELIVNSQPWRFLSINGSISYFKIDVDASNIGSGFDRSTYSWSSRLSTSVNLPEDLGVQVTYSYSGERVSAQGTIEPFTSMDIGLRKDFMDRKLSLSLRVSDVFDTRKFRFTVDDPLYRETAERRRDSRSIFFNVSYRFGNDERNQDRRRRRGEEREDSDDDFDF